jgi:multiple sugar transport system substrate-binding protein
MEHHRSGARLWRLGKSTEPAPGSVPTRATDTMGQRRRRRPVKAAAVLLAATSLGLAACGSSTKAAAPSSTTTKTSSSKVVDLTFWSWVPGIAQQVKLFNASHTHIHVHLVKTPTGTSGAYAKMLAAIKAGDPPDVGQIEFDVLPSFVATGGILNLAKYGAEKDASQFSPFAWKLVDFGGGVWAIPQATGPTAMFYNAKLFKKYGLAVPKTWAQFASEAIAVHKAHPNVYMTNWPDSTSWLAMSEWQAGAKWFSESHNAWKLGFTSPTSTKVADYWQKLISSGALKIEKSFTAAWYHQAADGEILAWPTAQWATTIMADDVKSGSGDWRVAPMPQWTAGANDYGQWGGSTTAVFKDTKHPRSALKFALWMNTDLKAIQAGVVAGFGWPAATAGLKVSALHGTFSFFGPQHIYKDFRVSEADTVKGWNFGPDYLTADSQMDGLMSGLSSGSITLPEVLAKTQAKQLSTLKAEGISVKG